MSKKTKQMKLIMFENRIHLRRDEDTFKKVNKF